jgi:uncharacterized membrane protein YjgN (DUF898 family)
MAPVKRGYVYMGVGNQDETAIAFEGSWQEFAPIALTNFVLTLVTLGFYRFWATTRERQYFWSRTRFIDDNFEWTGKGLELFVGFLIVLVLFGIPFIALQFFAQALIMQGHGGLFFGLTFGLYIFWGYLGGIAMFRALRYRLSRTYWHGIHGGTDEPGWVYGWSFLWKNVVAYLCMAVLFPWSMTALWKERWEAMSFGPHRFQSTPEWGSLMPRYLLAYFAPIGIMIVMMVVLIPIAIAAGSGSSGGEPDATMLGATIGLLVVGFYVLWPLVALIFYSAYMREVIGTMRLSTLEFYFGARTKDWVKLFLGNVGIYLIAAAIAAIPIGALGLYSMFTDLQPGHSPFGDNPIGYIGALVLIAIPFGLVGPFVRYRSWAFFTRHIEVGGIIDLAALTQSETRELKQGEGLLDAFDMGAM